MSTKKQTLLAVTLGVILSLTVLSANVPHAIADDDHKKTKNHFSKKADFESNDCIITGFADNLPDESKANLDCQMKAWLDEKGSTLKYQIQVSGMQLIDSNNNSEDDIDGIHIHKNPTGAANPVGPHQLNVFGNPNFDDSDVVVKPVQGIVRGVWTDEDENTSYGEPDNSHKLSENLQLLCEGKIFAAIHGEFEDSPGHNAPYLKVVLEPTKDGQKICKHLGY